MLQCHCFFCYFHCFSKASESLQPFPPTARVSRSMYFLICAEAKHCWGLGVLPLWKQKTRTTRPVCTCFLTRLHWHNSSEFICLCFFLNVIIFPLKQCPLIQCCICCILGQSVYLDLLDFMLAWSTNCLIICKKNPLTYLTGGFILSERSRKTSNFTALVQKHVCAPAKDGLDFLVL